MNQTQLTELLQGALTELDVAGGGQVAIHDGREVVSAAAGIANAKGQLPVVDQTLFQIGSTTKIYNAVLLMQLVESGEVDLDQPVAAYLDVRISPEAREDVITPRHLLSMTSGIDNGPYHDTGRNDDAVEKYLSCLADIPMVHEPGHGYGYTNASSDIAGRITELKRGKSWDDVLTEHLIGPLALEHTDALQERILQHPVAVGHTGTRSEPSPLPFWALYRGHAPAGATLCASASDLTRLGQTLLGDGNGVLSAESLAQMHTKQVDTPTRFMAHGWCLGPYYKVWDGVEIYGHSGTNMGGSSTLLWIPSKGMSIAVTCNEPPNGYPLAELCFREILAEQGIQMPDKAKPTDPESGIDSLPGMYTAHGVEIEISQIDERTLHAHKESRQFPGFEQTLDSDLHPLGDGRYLVEDAAFSGGRDWDIAFWDKHLTDGVFTLRKEK